MSFRHSKFCQNLSKTVQFPTPKTYKSESRTKLAYSYSTVMNSVQNRRSKCPQTEERSGTSRRLGRRRTKCKTKGSIREMNFELVDIYKGHASRHPVFIQIICYMSPPVDSGGKSDLCVFCMRTWLYIYIYHVILFGKNRNFPSTTPVYCSALSPIIGCCFYFRQQGDYLYCM